MADGREEDSEFLLLALALPCVNLSSGTLGSRAEFESTFLKALPKDHCKDLAGSNPQGVRLHTQRWLPSKPGRGNVNAGP